MQHMLVADKSLLVGDAVAELVLQYAALLGRIGSADTVKLRAFGSDGDEVVAGLLLNAGTVLVIETSSTSLTDPDNAEAEAYLRERIAGYSPDDATPFGPAATS